MDINFNIGFLKTLYGPLNQSLTLALDDIKSNASLVASNKVTKIAALDLKCIEHIHSAKSALEMIDLMGVAVILGKLETLLKEADSLKVKLPELFLAADAAVQNIIYYVEQLSKNNPDNPHQLYAYYESIMKLLGDRASHYDLFFPKIDATNNTDIENYYRHHSIDNLGSVTKSAKNTILTLTTLIKAKDNIQEIQAELLNLQKLEINKHWHVMLLLIQSYFSYLNTDETAEQQRDVLDDKILSELQDLSFQLDSASTKNLKKIKSSKETQKYLLYFMAQRIHANPSLLEEYHIKELHNLINIYSYTNQIDSQPLVVNNLQIEPDLKDNISKAMGEFSVEFASFLEQPNPDFIIQIDKIFVLVQKLNMPQTLVLLRKVKEVCQKFASQDLVAAQELSLAVNFIDKIIQLHVSLLKQEETYDEQQQISTVIDRLNLVLNHEEVAMAALPKLIKNNDSRKHNVTLYHHLATELQQVTEIINQFFQTKGENVDELKQVIEILNSARGALTMGGKPDLAAYMKEAGEVFTKLTVSAQSVMVDDVKKIANHIAGIILYVDALKNDDQDEAENIYMRIRNIESTVVPQFTKPAEAIRERVDLSHINKTVEIETGKSEFLDTINNDELFEIFMMESEEVIEQLREDLEALAKNVANTELSKSIRRHFHTLKGSSRMIGLMHFAEAPWIVEQTLNKKIELGENLDVELISVLGEVADIIEEWLQNLQDSDNKVLVSNAKIVQDLILPFNPKASFSFNIYAQDTQVVEDNFHSEALAVAAKLELLADGDELVLGPEFNLQSNKLLSLAKAADYPEIEGILLKILNLGSAYKTVENKDSILNAITLIKKLIDHINVSKEEYASVLQAIEQDSEVVVSQNEVKEAEKEIYKEVEKLNEEKLLQERMMLEKMDEILSKISVMADTISKLESRNADLLAEIGKKDAQIDNLVASQNSNMRDITRQQSEFINSLPSNTQVDYEQLNDKIIEALTIVLQDKFTESKEHNKKMIYSAFNIVQKAIKDKKGLFF